MKKNVFIAHSPYHVLIACGVASEKRYDDNTLFIFLEFGDSELLVQTLRSWEKCPFKSIVCVAADYGLENSRNRWKRYAVRRRGGLRILSFLRSERTDNVYVFNDERTQTQYALRYVRQNRARVKAIHVEDGSAPYNSNLAPKRPLKAVILSKIVFGFWWKEVRVLGLSDEIDEVLVIFPQFVRPELKKKNLVALNKSSFKSLQDSQFLENYFKKFNIPFASLKNTNVILLVAHTETSARYEKYGPCIKQLVGYLTQLGYVVSIKYHPRELTKNYLAFNEQRNVEVLPQTLPVELLYLFAESSIEFVISDISTGLLTASWLLSKARVLSFAALVGRNDEQLFKLFRALNICIPSTIREMTNELDKKNGSAKHLSGLPK